MPTKRANNNSHWKAAHDAIVKAIASKSTTGRETAKKAGVTETYWCDVQAGRYMTTMRTLMRLADAVGLKINITVD